LTVSVVQFWVNDIFKRNFAVSRIELFFRFSVEFIVIVIVVVVVVVIVVVTQVVISGHSSLT